MTRRAGLLDMRHFLQLLLRLALRLVRDARHEWQLVCHPPGA
jgi:hypothetical protein